jgi:hypothetical protein
MRTSCVAAAAIHRDLDSLPIEDGSEGGAGELAALVSLYVFEATRNRCPGAGATLPHAQSVAIAPSFVYSTISSGFKMR